MPIFKSGDKNIPSNYRSITISHILAKLYGFILEKKLTVWLENHGKRAKGKVGFRRHHSIIDHLVTLRIIVKAHQNSKRDPFYCFLDFRKDFNTIPRDKLWERLEEIMVPTKLRIAMICLYQTVIAKVKTNEGWSKDIKCNVRVKQGCPLSHTLFGIYINKQEECLEIAGCKGTKLAGIIITLLLYVDDIVLPFFLQGTMMNYTNNLRLSMSTAPRWV